MSPQAVSDPAAVNTFLNRLGWGALTIGRRSVTESGLADLLKAESKAQSAFDVTACKNSAVAGAVAWLVSRGGSPIYSFESKKRPTYGAADLLPLLANDEYVYRDLSQSPLVKAASSRVNFWTLKRKQFLLWSAAAAVVFALVTTTLSQSVAFSVLSGVASFASIVSIFAIFVREDL